MTRTNKIKMLEAIFKLEGREDELPDITEKLIRGSIVPDRESRDEYLEGNLDWLHTMGKEHGISISMKLMEEYQRLVKEKGNNGGLELYWAPTGQVLEQRKQKQKTQKTQDSLVVSIT